MVKRTRQIGALLLVAVAAASVVVETYAPEASAAERRNCGRIIYTPSSDDSVSKIVAVGLTCTSARRALYRYHYLKGGGWRCKKVPGTGDGLQGSGRFHCRKNGKLIAYSYP